MSANVPSLPGAAAASPDATDLAVIGGYSVVGELGRGGMGKVFLARRTGQMGFERLFAIKVLHEDMLDEPEAALMLLDEARIAARLHHPNVVPIVDIGEYEGGQYLVMDYVEGCSLAELLRRHKKERPPKLVVPMMLDALRGLHAAHEMTEPDGTPSMLVHRDFSPQNLLIGLDGTCRVTDFGIAKVSARLSVTKASVNKGKLAYMSPEQLAGSADIDRRADVWAAGVVLFFALTGTHPLRGDNEAETVTNILRKPIERASESGLRPPKCLDQICFRALQRRRKDRFDSALAMADALHQVAIANDLLGSPSAVGAWINTSFAKELEERREAIRTRTGIASARGQIPRLEPTGSKKSAVVPISLDVDLPADEPSDWGGGDALEVPDLPGAPPVTPPPMSIATARTALEPAPATPAAPVAAASGPSRRRPGTPLLAGIAVAAIAVVAAAVLLVRPASEGVRATEGQSQAGLGAPAGSQEPQATDPGDTAGSAALALAVAPPDAGPSAAEPGTGVSTGIADAGPTEPSAASPDEAMADAAAASPGEASPSEISVRLRSLPAGARVRLDGRTVAGPVLRVPVDGRDHSIRVEADGYETWTTRVGGAVDRSIEVRLERGGPGRVVRDPGF